MINRGTGGSAGSSGYDYQARAIAYVATHMLVRHPLLWTRKTFDVPVAIEAEVGRAGDDIQIEFEDKHCSYSVQAKRRVSGRVDLLDAVGGFLADLPGTATECGVLLVVGRRRRAKSVANFWMTWTDLRDGRTEPLHEMVQHILAAVKSRGTPRSPPPTLHRARGA